ncbi:MAG: tRNA pseudouridine(38-40) synthase TruA [Bacteroidota bacterium]|jgi:tRNA pseudouridine38-40 synthase|nr:tRNA pseudouridine(38-40) synthase TruA [Ignavibacteria bacterium]MCU7500432.1 tRNA pseudouridine(38-40) synthase TruA [Ignavibacteria bacterium]MCU7512832.1 tRNA pseudouridine(38-40) synthase TruA [Ignavibacteria bacterium]MCU7521814.1 tRNA pseudouridine(38-40) synthase TruA [Ignavibacteria bacterium]MCU7525972.1 tRNA pseudouridine(38-40) synthase TruA [Ignavibacteria bacterium]
MQNYKLNIQYDGTRYAGWQVQENAVTVQQKVTEALETLTKEKINLIGSGRTDTGVHALGQAANFRTEKELNIYKFRHSLNAILPTDIAVSEMSFAGETFHARFDAKKRSYLYFITKDKSPFYEKYSYLYRGRLEVEKLNRLSKLFMGEHDFTSFSRKKSEVSHKRCIIYDAHWKETNGFVIFYIEANRFLHGMVRTITGTLLHAVRNDLKEAYIQDILQKRERESAGEAAPSKGLFLYKVKY